MFISNIKDMKKESTMCFPLKLAKRIENKTGILSISNDGKFYYFSKSKKINSFLDDFSMIDKIRYGKYLKKEQCNEK